MVKDPLARVKFKSATSRVALLIVVVNPFTNKFPLIVTVPVSSLYADGSIIKSGGPLNTPLNVVSPDTVKAPKEPVLATFKVVPKFTAPEAPKVPFATKLLNVVLPVTLKVLPKAAAPEAAKVLPKVAAPEPCKVPPRVVGTLPATVKDELKVCTRPINPVFLVLATVNAKSEPIIGPILLVLPFAIKLEFPH